MPQPRTLKDQLEAEIAESEAKAAAKPGFHDGGDWPDALSASEFSLSELKATTATVYLVLPGEEVKSDPNKPVHEA
jgi:hypothetical protein